MTRDANTPIFVGIAGGIGSGKSTVAANIAGGLPQESVALLDHDSYYKHHPEMPFEERELLNYDHPDALDNELLIQHLDALREGRGIEAPFMTSARMRATETRRVAPCPVVIVEGILVFVDSRLRDRLDVKVFVDTDADIRVFRRIRRDMESRRPNVPTGP